MAWGVRGERLLHRLLDERLQVGRGANGLGRWRSGCGFGGLALGLHGFQGRSDGAEGGQEGLEPRLQLGVVASSYGVRPFQGAHTDFEARRDRRLVHIPRGRAARPGLALRRGRWLGRLGRGVGTWRQLGRGLLVDLHGEQVLARLAVFHGVRAIALRATHRIRLAATTLHGGTAVVGKRHRAVLRQGQRFRQPLRVGRRLQRVRRVHASLLPGHQGLVAVAEESRHVVGHAGW